MNFIFILISILIGLSICQDCTPYQNDCYGCQAAEGCNWCQTKEYGEGCNLNAAKTDCINKYQGVWNGPCPLLTGETSATPNGSPGNTKPTTAPQPTTPAPTINPELKWSCSQWYSTSEALGWDASGTVQIYQDSSNKVWIQFKDFIPKKSGRTASGAFVAHAHVGTCKNDGEGHWKKDSAITDTVASNEIWSPTFTIASSTITNTGPKVDGPLDETLISVIVHEKVGEMSPKRLCCELMTPTLKPNITPSPTFATPRPVNNVPVSPVSPTPPSTNNNNNGGAMSTIDPRCVGYDSRKRNAKQCQTWGNMKNNLVGNNCNYFWGPEHDSKCVVLENACIAPKGSTEKCGFITCSDPTVCERQMGAGWTCGKAVLIEDDGTQQFGPGTSQSDLDKICAASNVQLSLLLLIAMIVLSFN